MKYLIETSVIVNYLNDRKGVGEFLENLGGELSSSYVCLAELYEGAVRSKEPEEEKKGLLAFFSGMTEVYGLDPEIARIFGQIRAELKKKGMIIEDLDILIAATCLAYGLTLVTQNPRHFERVRGLDILTPGAS